MSETSNPAPSSNGGRTPSGTFANGSAPLSAKRSYSGGLVGMKGTKKILYELLDAPYPGDEKARSIIEMAFENMHAMMFQLDKEGGLSDVAFKANKWVLEMKYGKPKISAEMKVSGEAFIQQLHTLRSAPQFFRSSEIVDHPNGTVNGSGHRDHHVNGSQDAPERAGEEGASDSD